MPSPNILFIIADQHNAKVLGHQGHPEVRTPHLDRMAAEGVRCDKAITQSPICTPSRVSFLSGQYCHNHGYYGLSGPRPAGLPSLFGYFRRAGYTTAAIGKIHCPEYWIEDDCDVFHETCNCSIDGRSPDYTRFLAARGKADLEDHGGLPEFGAGGVQSMEGRPSTLSFDEAQEGWIAAQAIEVMQRAAQQGRSFLVHASLPRPHQCTSPSPEFWELYEGVDLTLPANADHDLEGKAPHLRRAAARWRRGDWTLIEPRTFDAGRQRKLRGYLAAVSQVDHAVGRMLDFLRRSGLAQDTVVVYGADHGDYACEHGIMEKAPGICSDAITRVPLIWWGQGRFREGYVVPEVVELVDVPVTLCALASLPLLETADGRDLSPLLHGEVGDEDRVGVTEFAWSKSVRQGRFRYVHYPPDMFPHEHPQGFGELYDLKADPWELRNLWSEPDYRETVARMQQELLDWLITTARPGTVLQANSGNNARMGLNPQRRRRYHCVTNRDGRIHPDRLRDIAGGNYL